jgi:hypothetical protein
VDVSSTPLQASIAQSGAIGSLSNAPEGIALSLVKNLGIATSHGTKLRGSPHANVPSHTTTSPTSNLHV